MATLTTLLTTTMKFDIDDNKLTQIHTFQLKAVGKDEPQTQQKQHRDKAWPMKEPNMLDSIHLA